jgi:hypothetical protein
MCQGMIWLSFRAFTYPLRMACIKSTAPQYVIPDGSGVMFPDATYPHGPSMMNPQPKSMLGSGCPCASCGV